MDLHARAIALHDDFTHNHLDRRRFFAELAKLAGGVAAAQALAAAIAADPAAAAMIAPEDKRVTASWITIPGSAGELLKAYFVEPSGKARRRPAVLVIHENRGLNAHIEDVARRLAVAGFAALAVDFLSVAGGTPGDENQARTLIGTLDPQRATADAIAAIGWLKADKRTNGKAGAVGFCWGGALVNRLAVAAGAELGAGVAFYGPPPPPSEAVRVKAPLMLHYAGTDERVNAGATPWVEALDAAGATVVRHDYPGTQHAFHNDTSAARYDKAAATLAWDRTLAFFRRILA